MYKKSNSFAYANEFDFLYIKHVSRRKKLLVRHNKVAKYLFDYIF